jgi:hypothetical protein
VLKQHWGIVLIHIISAVATDDRPNSALKSVTANSLAMEIGIVHFMRLLLGIASLFFDRDALPTKCRGF